MPIVDQVIAHAMTPQQAKLAAWTVVIVIVLFLWNERAKSKRLDNYARQTGELLKSGSFRG